MRAAPCKPPVLLWFRQDLRLADQPAVHAAIASGQPVLPVYVLDQASGGPWAPGGASRWWLFFSLRSLADGLARHAAPLLLRRGRWENVLPRLAAETGATAIHAGRMAEPWARRAEAAIGRHVPLHLPRTGTLFDPEIIRTASGGPFGVYSPFVRAARAAPPPTALLPAPHLPERSLRKAFSGLPWRHDRRGLRAWQRGRSGIPMVDAGMRQLWQTGWMHNRVRMIAGSFLVKHLLTAWQVGEAWFWDTLVDADLASNAASWQWVTGCRVDSQPFFRVFNPVLQGKKFDPDGAYVRRFVSELARLPDTHVHAPWEAPETVLEAAGVALDRTYLRPIVGLSEGRARALDAYRDVSVGGDHPVIPNPVIPNPVIPNPVIPAGARIRVVGDVHGDARAFAHAADTDRFVIQLGDLTDEGPDSAGALRIALRLRNEHRGLFLLGNHDHKLARALAGRDVRIDPGLAATLAQLDPELRARAAVAIGTAPAWLGVGRAFFVHGGFHAAMLHTPPPVGPARTDCLLSRALFGQVTGRTRFDGYPERVLDWIDRIPAGVTVYCGHDRRSRDGRPWVRPGAAGGTAVFLDTGAGKGGHLSWIDL